MLLTRSSLIWSRLSKGVFPLYKGFKEYYANNTDLAYLYEHMNENVAECAVNEYLIVRNEAGEVIDKLKWTGSEYKHLAYKTLANDYVGKIRPRNLQQELAFDMLQDEETTVKALLGCFGSGKTMLMIATALQLVRQGKFERIVYVRNNIEVKDSKPLGALPGTANEKLMPFAMPFADHVGGMDGLEYLQRTGKLEITHLGYLRGRDIKNSILMVSESGNLTREHMQLLLGRVGEGSNLWLDGDLKQVDMRVFEQNSGLSAAIDRLKGNHLFAYVHLEKTERSETAALADLLD